MKALKVDNTKFLGFDVETKGSKNKFVCASLVNDEICNFYKSQEELIKDLTHTHWMRKYKIVATNLEFDFNAVFGKRTKDIERIYRGKLLACKVKLKEKQKLNFWDTLSFVPASVEKLGNTIGIPKLEHPSCFAKQPKNKDEWNELKDYNIRDSFISYSFMEQLRKAVNSLGGKMRMTVASTTMDVWKRKYLMGIQLQPHRNVIQDMYKSYYGGRTEAIRRGCFKKINYYDFNSLYPSVMLENEYPDVNSIKVSRYLNLEHEGFSLVLVESPDAHVPILPYKTDKLIFPTGTFKGWYNHNELRYAIENGYKIKKFFKGYHFTDTINFFKDFVKDLYSKRLKYKKEGNDVMQMTCKLLLNSLYGKFAQNVQEETKIIHDNELTLNVYDEWEQVNEIRDNFYALKRKVKRPLSSFILPVWSSYVTSYARIKLHKALPKDIIYMDTDSLMTKRELGDSKELGGLKKEYKLNDVVVVKPKMYYFRDENNKEYVKLKGVGRINKEKFFNILDGNKTPIQRFIKFKESVRRSLVPNETLNFFKNINLEDSKRNWLNNFNPDSQEDSLPLGGENLEVFENV